LEVLGCECDSDLLVGGELTPLAVLEPLRINAFPGLLETADVKDQRFEALHETLANRDVEINRVNFPTDSRTPLELAREGVHEVDCHVELLQVEFCVIVVDV
jgi:hypothetical protein